MAKFHQSRKNFLIRSFLRVCFRTISGCEIRDFLVVLEWIIPSRPDAWNGRPVISKPQFYPGSPASLAKVRTFTTGEHPDAFF